MLAEYDDKEHDGCGVFGVFGLDPKITSRVVNQGNYALGHRGQDGGGIAVSNGHRIYSSRIEGPARLDSFDDVTLDSLEGHMGIAHRRYATSGGKSIKHLQPTVDNDGVLALAQNGNLVDTSDLYDLLDSNQIPVDGLNDTELIHRNLLRLLNKGARLEDAYYDTLPYLHGSYALLAMTRDKLSIAVDKCGIKPAVIGRLGGGIIFASETYALDQVGADFVRHIDAGEFLVVDKYGYTMGYQIPGSKLTLDSFEAIYFAKPESIILGQRVKDMRINMGRQLALEHPIDADLVLGVPDSGLYIAQGYSQVTGIPYCEVLRKNGGRSFMQPDQASRDAVAESKYYMDNPDMLIGKKIIVVDDSVVRGTTKPRVISKLRSHSVLEANGLIASPPYRHPDHLGTDTVAIEELIANRMSIEEMRVYFGLDGFGYISLVGLKKAFGEASQFMTFHVFDGQYPNYRNSRNFDKISVNIL